MLVIILQNGIAQQERIVNDLKDLTKRILVQTNELEEICVEDFLRLIQSRPENHIVSNGFVGGGFYPLQPVLHNDSEEDGLHEEIKNIMIKNGLKLGGHVEVEKQIYLYSGKGKRGRETTYGLWRVVQDQSGIFIHSPSGRHHLDPICITSATYQGTPEAKKRLLICPSRGAPWAMNAILGKEYCVDEEDWEDHLNE